MHSKSHTLIVISCLCFLLFASFINFNNPIWSSSFVQVLPSGHLHYNMDKQGNILPDFSRVGYMEGTVKIPNIKIVKIIEAAKRGSSQSIIQSAIDEVSKYIPDKNGFRGAILLKKGIYNIEGTIQIHANGIVLRGEGEGLDGTRLIATGTTQRTLINISGEGAIKEISNTRVDIIDPFVALGSKSLSVSSAKHFKVGDSIVLFRPGTRAWIHDLKMDQIVERQGTKQWLPKEYNLEFERIITGIKGNKIFFDNPVVMEMETKYGGGAVFAYHYLGRIDKVGVENLYCGSEYNNDTAENHGWVAIRMDKIKNSWVQNVTSQYFGYACVSLGYGARNISVLHSNCFDAKSIITGGRRYSFNNDGQMNLFMDCHTTEGRHDFVTGAKVCGPNVFYNCSATNTHADIGPHHRWAMGTLYDNVKTTGEINIQDRGNWGSGHGWSGVNQILWNCSAKAAVVQDPWVSGHNYCIGLQGSIGKGRLIGRNQGIWEGQNKKGLQPASLYMAQLKQRLINQ